MEYAEGMDEVPIKLNIHAYQGIQYNLDDLGIKVKLDDEIEGNRDGYMFKY